MISSFAFEHDLRANAVRLSRGKTGLHFALTRPFGSGSCSRRLSRADYFLRKRSSRTTSAPSLGLAGSPGVSAAGAETGRAEPTGEGAGTAGRLVAGASLAAASDGSNCRPNCTEGSKKLLMELK